MLGWLKKRSRREQRKLVAQNIIASGEGYLRGYFSADSAIILRLDEIYNLSLLARDRLKSDELLDGYALQLLLSMNKELRRLHGRVPSVFVSPFDEHYAPARGWDVYLVD